MSGYVNSYKPFRINSNKCSNCPQPAIVTDQNGNNYSGTTLLKTKKEKCAYNLKNKKNLFPTDINLMAKMYSTQPNAFGRLSGTTGGSGTKLTNKF
tara:strand:+ start:989 stop:1276 length:288 start_codon:yes stop_codon:yes gene_type:complete